MHPKLESLIGKTKKLFARQRKKPLADLNKSVTTMIDLGNELCAENIGLKEDRNETVAEIASITKRVDEAVADITAKRKGVS